MKPFAGPAVILAVATLVVAACSSSSHSPSKKDLGAKYLAVAEPANKLLDHDFDAFEDAAKDDLAAATMQLKAVAGVERGFDKALADLHLPKPYAATVTALINVNEVRATLTDEAATASDLTELHAYQTQLDAMNVRLEDQVKVLRSQLGLPPPDTD